ncbi:hypothetical protein JCGZ_04136 [Jatropha curcas]|uniref:Uncharacterized protein n=1 Tax=Jatropha curcas TaxID=180498 RepID=A0A067JA31_JATCU|nr:hypothetical protein JCGZ_04136 [Jatropha curcas]
MRWRNDAHEVLGMRWVGQLRFGVAKNEIEAWKASCVDRKGRNRSSSLSRWQHYDRMEMERVVAGEAMATQKKSD